MLGGVTSRGHREMVPRAHGVSLKKKKPGDHWGPGTLER